MGDIMKDFFDILDRRSQPSTDELFGKVLEVDNNSALVQIVGGSKVKLWNKSKEKLSVNDSVVVRLINGNLSNAFISLKFG